MHPNLKSILVNTDSYKVSMPKQYPPGTENVFSYIESRGGKYDGILFFGLQSFIADYLHKQITRDEVDFADIFWKTHGEPFDRSIWDHVIDKYDGWLPLKISAVAEGTFVPTGNILVSVENTGDEITRGVTTHVETALLRAAWYSSTVATISYSIKNLIRGYLEKSGDVSGLPFKLHDFGARGVSSAESAALGGAAHLVNFMGSDNTLGILELYSNYEAKLEEIGFSIPATEHSTITSWGRENEKEAYRNVIKQFGKPGALFACVSDSYDIYKACHMWGELKDEIIASGGTLVIRPDSGDPLVVLPAMFQIIDKYFGHTVNDKGYKVLNHVRFLWGDGIDEMSITSILRNVVDFNGWSADNIAFGMGGALLQHCDRDWQRWAMKCSSVKVNGEWRDVFKDPITDPGKASKKGRLALYKHHDGSFYTGREDWPENQLKEVWNTGNWITITNLAEVRANAEL